MRCHLCHSISTMWEETGACERAQLYNKVRFNISICSGQNPNYPMHSGVK